MADYKIDGFWISRLGKPSGTRSDSLVQGWTIKTSRLPTFLEAPLTVSDAFGNDSEPMNSSVLLVSAPGAVGKSTLAGEIAFATGAIHIDLAVADQVGAFFLLGGLFKSGLVQSVQSPTPALVIDGLDEARLKVTEGAFRTFLTEVAELSKTNAAPLVLFGRTRAVEEAWLVLADAGVRATVLEIGFFEPDDALNFAYMKLRERKPDNSYETAERKALRILLQQLRDQTETDGDRFAGYAPVLQAVADRVARETNAMGFVSELEQGIQDGQVTVRSIAYAILEREQGKLARLSLEDKSLIDILYSPEEQLERLVSRVYNLAEPELPPMSQSDAQIYNNALEEWVGEHPFLDGGFSPSSAVFDAMITATALHSTDASRAELQKELMKGMGCNPFLFTFYLNASDNTIHREHIGVVYASLRASLALGDVASLFVTEDENDGGLAEILLSRQGVDNFVEFELPFDFSDDHVEQIFLGSHIEDVTVFAPTAKLEIGGTVTESVMIAPVSIQCRELSISAARLVVESRPQNHDNVVYLEAEKYSSTTLFQIPLTRGEVKLCAWWPDVSTHPWTNFATTKATVPDARIDEGLRRFKHFVIAFRSHGRGRLARHASKIGSTRMTKGAGQAVLDLMINEGILSLEQLRYFLNQDKLSEVTGMHYHDCMASRFDQRAVDFVQRALESR